MKEMLKILTWNANGLIQRLDELEIFIRGKDIDICLVCETHLTKQSNVKIRGYSEYHAFHPSERARGGSSLFIKECIEHSAEIKIELEAMQVTTVRVKNNHLSFNISSIYCPLRC